jgi:hypothetical protein
LTPETRENVDDDDNYIHLLWCLQKILAYQRETLKYIINTNTKKIKNKKWNQQCWHIRLKD